MKLGCIDEYMTPITANILPIAYQPGRESYRRPLSCSIIVRNISIFAGVLVALTVGLNSLSLYPDSHNSNIRYLLDHKDDFNVVFFGSSAIHNMINPRIFDEIVESEGYVVNSYNAGNGASWAHETNHSIRSFLNAGPRDIDFIFIDSFPFKHSAGPGPQRSEQWHDLRETRSVLRTVSLSSRLSENQKRDLRKKHLWLMLKKYTPIGISGDLWRFPGILGWRNSQSDRLRPTGATPYSQQINKGYLSFSEIEANYGISVERKRFLKGTSRFTNLKKMRKKQAAQKTPYSLRSYNVKAIRMQVAQILKNGATPIYIVSPALLSNPNLSRALKMNKYTPHTFFFDDQEDFPELFEENNRYDIGHLNDETSAYYTALIAREFVLLLDSNPECSSKVAKSQIEQPDPKS